METNIIYKYRAPDAPPGSEVTIATKVMELDHSEVLNTLHQPGETIALETYDPNKYGEGSTEYVVLGRHPLVTQWGGLWAGSSVGASILVVIVTNAADA